jgi:DNA-3-methyladenine glycosylase II
MTPTYWDKAKRALRRRDPILRSVIRSYQGERLRLQGKRFHTLARAIVGQQISVKAADSIWKRLNKAAVRVTPKRIANAPNDMLRGCGLSNAKVLYMHSLAKHFLENGPQIKKWPLLDDEAIIQELITIKGVGRWTAEMFLIFSLGRADVFPIDDLGLIRGLSRHYNNGQRMTKADVIALATAGDLIARSGHGTCGAYLAPFRGQVWSLSVS